MFFKEIRIYSNESLQLLCIVAAPKSYLTVLNYWRVQLSLGNTHKFNSFQNHYYLAPPITAV